MNMVAFVVIVLCSSIIAAAQEDTSMITLEDLVFEYTPVLEPRPCSVWLTRWGASADEVKEAAERIGLKLLDSSRIPKDCATIYMYTDREEEIFLSFSVIDGSYRLFTCAISYEDVARANTWVNEARQEIQDYWGGDGTVTTAIAVCDQTNQQVMIKVDRHLTAVTYIIQIPD